MDWQSSRLLNYGNYYFIALIPDGNLMKINSKLIHYLSFLQNMTEPDPVWTKLGFASVIRFATGTWHLCSKRASQSSATANAVGE